MRRLINLVDRYDSSTGEARSEAKRQLSFYGVAAEAFYIDEDDDR